MQFVKYTQSVIDMKKENGVMCGSIIKGQDGIYFISSASILCNLKPDDFRDLANKLDELNGVETKFNPLSIIENTMESLDEERKRFKEKYDRTEDQINQGVRPAGKRFKL